MTPVSDRPDEPPRHRTPAPATEGVAGQGRSGQAAAPTGRRPTAWRLPTALSLLILTAGCNSTDALTPQVDVGNGSFNSPPVTQRDLDGMANQGPVTGNQQMAANQATGQNEQPINGQTLAPPPSTTTTALQQTTPAANGTYRDPAGTLEGQAAALGTQPAPVQQQPAAQSTATQQPATQQAAAQQPASQTAAVNPQSGALSVRFLPIIGAPVQAVTPLSRQLGADARAKGITIKSASDASAQHMLKGYFSAFADGSSTTVTYVWDVLDASGNRLNRIQGQEKAPGGGADPWASVPAATMQTIADKTIDSYLAWRNGR